MIEIIAITELINAGEFDTEMIEANSKIPNQERTNADHPPKPSNEITPDKRRKKTHILQSAGLDRISIVLYISPQVPSHSFSINTFIHFS